MKFILIVFFVACLTNSYSDVLQYKSFYYKDKEFLEKRLVKYLQSGPEILVNYPQSEIPEEIRTESELMLNYGIAIDLKTLTRELDAAIRRKDYYGLVMISASLQGDAESKKLKLFLIETAQKNLTNDAFANHVLGLIVDIVINKSFLFDDKMIDRKSLNAIIDFAKALKGKEKENDEKFDFDDLHSIILEDALRELVR